MEKFSGMRVREAREFRGWCLEDVAARMILTPSLLADKRPITAGDVEDWEDGLVVPSRGEQLRLSVALNVPMTRFYLPDPPDDSDWYKRSSLWLHYRKPGPWSKYERHKRVPEVEHIEACPQSYPSLPGSPCLCAYLRKVGCS